MRCGSHGAVEGMDSRQALLKTGWRESYGSSGLWNAASFDDGLKSRYGLGCDNNN